MEKGEDTKKIYKCCIYTDRGYGAYDQCVFDMGDIQNCSHAATLHVFHKGKEDCEFWREVKNDGGNDDG